MISNSFVWGDDGKAITPEDARRRREVAMAMIQQGTAGRPIQHWTQGAANVAQALLGAYDMRQADNKENAAREAAKAGDAQFLGMIGGGGAAAPAMGGASPNPLANVQPMAMGSDLDRAANAITSIESGGRYDALGPVTKSGDRAFGRYQVMGANIPSWTEQYAGRRMTPQEFLASQEAQDAVFRGEFGRLKQKHGPEGAARAWFAGEGGMNNPNARDILGTSVADYSRKFTSAFAPGQAPAAASQASAAGAAPNAPVQQVAQANPQLLQAAMARMSDPYASAGSRAVAQALVQRIISQQSQDPRDSRLKDLSIAEKEAALRNNTGDLDRQLKQRQLESGDLTTDQRELAQVNKERAAANLPALRMDQWKIEKSKAGATTVNIGQDGQQYGNPGDGLVWQRDPTGKVVIDERGAPVAIPFRGGKMFNEEQKRAETKAEQGKQKLTQADMIMQDIDRTLGLMDNAILPTTGAIGSLLTNVPSTAAADMARLTDGIKANIGFDKLAEMRAASPTGAALGSVTEKELAFLQSVVGSLEQSQSAPQYRYNLLRLKNAYLDTVHGPGQGPQREKLPEVPTRREAQQPAQQQAPAAPQPGKVLRYNPQTGALE